MIYSNAEVTLCERHRGSHLDAVCDVLNPLNMHFCRRHFIYFLQPGNDERAKYNKRRLLCNQRSRPLVVRRENAALTHEAQTAIQREESPPGGQERECSFKT